MPPISSGNEGRPSGAWRRSSSRRRPMKGSAASKTASCWRYSRKQSVSPTRPGTDRCVVDVRDRKRLLEVCASAKHEVFDNTFERREPIVAKLTREWNVPGSRVDFDRGASSARSRPA
jgi:hypothetical protein